MNEIAKRLQLNKFSLFLIFLIAFIAAFFTLCFALLEGVKNITTILFRVFISFSFFAVIGYFISVLLEKEYLKTFLRDEENQQKNVDEKIVAEDNFEQYREDTSTGTEEVTGLTDSGSFDKIVVVDEDADE